MRLNYKVTGFSDSPCDIPTLLLHGFLGRGSDWDEVTSSSDGEFIVPDLPGHGGSVNLPSETCTMDETARAIVRIMDDTGTKTCNVVGYSMGGRLALYLALEYPERLASLVLESASPGLRTAEERRRRRNSDERLACRLESADPEDFRAFLGEWHRQPLFSSLGDHAGLVERLISDRLVSDPRELAKSLRGMGTGSQPSLWEELPALRVPTLAIVGEFDEKFRRIAEEMSALNPNVSVEVVAGAGHNVHIERLKEFVRLLKRVVGED